MENIDKISIMKNIKYVALIILLHVLLSESYAQDWANLKHYKAANEKIKDSTINAVFMGDSITDFWLLSDSVFFYQNHFIDRGISGQTSPQMLLRFRQDVISLRPKTVVLLCGTNDIAGNTGLSTLEMIEDNISSMTELAKINHIQVILCSVLPAEHFGWSPEVKPAGSIISLNQWIKAYAKRQRLAYVDYYASMVNDHKGLKKEYSSDGVHPNKNGYTIMKIIIQQKIAERL